MPEELGRIERPSAERYAAARKLLFVPLVFAPMEAPPELQERIRRYWDQVEAQIAHLEARLGRVARVYHELVPIGGEERAKSIEELNEGSARIVRARLGEGAELQPVEDAEILAEFMDWNRCLAIGLQSQKVVAHVFERYSDARKRRDEHIARRIDETLQSGEAALLLMQEGHRVQFGPDIQVFYVAPPALDDLKRWLRDQEARAESST